MLKLEWPLTGPISATLIDGSIIEGESGALYTNGDGYPLILQIISKQVVSIPWIQVRHVSHA